MKKIFIFILAIICVLSLYACTKEETPNNNFVPSASVAESNNTKSSVTSNTSLNTINTSSETIVSNSPSSSFSSSEKISSSSSTITSSKEPSFNNSSVDSSIENSSYSSSLTISESISSYSSSSSQNVSSSSSQEIVKTYYDITILETENGVIQTSKTSACKGEEITITATPSTGYKVDTIMVNDQSISDYVFVMEEKAVTIKVTFVKELYKITKSTITGGSITISTTTAYYGDTVTLTNSANAGYAFSSYKVDGKTQTANTFKMPAKNVSVGATFIKKIQSLKAFTFVDNANSNTSKTGNVTIGSGVCTNTQNYFPFVYGNNITADNFYFEAEITLTEIYNNEALSKCGIAFNVKNEAYFFCIDAFKSGFGTNKWVLFANGRGNVKTGVEWNWQDVSSRKHSFDGDYTNGKYVKLAVMRVGAFYKFFCNDALMFDMWLPNAVATTTIGIHSFNVGFEVKNAKYGTSDTVITNATAYYNQKANPTSVMVDGDIADWERNARYVYGYDNGTNYFYGAAFEGADAVYVAMVARTNSYITSNSGTNWYLNTNFEMRFGTTDDTQLYVSALPNGVQKSGDLTGETNKINSARIKKINDVGGYYLIYMECSIPYSIWGGTKSSDTNTRLGFAFRSGENGARMCEETTAQWWCGSIHINRQNLAIGAKGVAITSAPRIYTSNVSQIATIPIPTTDIRNVQGGWTDGTYFYQLFIKVRSNVDNETIMVKWNLSTQKEVARSGILPVDHANDLTYDSKNKRFVIVHNGSTANTVSFLDPNTLKLTGSKVLTRSLCGLDYNATKNQYVALISGNYNFIIFDENFNEVGNVVTTKSSWMSGFTRQGIACNDNYVAYILYNRDVIVVFDWAGNFKAFIEVDFPHNEGENITFISQTNYTSGFYVSSNDLTDYLIGADVFKITLKYRACG
ncbi:MAG: hypothetical protein J6C97_05370 [Clostridia bacterium]|nr:hypothetical protein [Clostridia bacterium]